MKVSSAVYIQYRAPSNNQSVFKMQTAVRVLLEYQPDQYLERNQVVLTIALGDSKREWKVIRSARWAARCSSMLRERVDSDAVTPWEMAHTMKRPMEPETRELPIRM